jgi:hypothetical protein
MGHSLLVNFFQKNIVIFLTQKLGIFGEFLGNFFSYINLTNFMRIYQQFFNITKMGGMTIAMTHEGVNFICQTKDPPKKNPLNPRPTRENSNSHSFQSFIAIKRASSSNPNHQRNVNIALNMLSVMMVMKEKMFMMAMKEKMWMMMMMMMMMKEKMFMVVMKEKMCMMMMMVKTVIEDGDEEKDDDDDDDDGEDGDTRWR